MTAFNQRKRSCIFFLMIILYRRSPLPFASFILRFQNIYKIMGQNNLFPLDWFYLQAFPQNFPHFALLRNIYFRRSIKHQREIAISRIELYRTHITNDLSSKQDYFVQHFFSSRERKWQDEIFICWICNINKTTTTYKKCVLSHWRKKYI